MRALIVAAAAGMLLAMFSMPTKVSAQSRGWLINQGVWCPDGKRARNVEVCHRRAARAANKKK
jgi:hypothetical protein